MNTPPSIRNRTRRWYLVVQARRLMDAGYAQQDAAQRLGIGARTIRRWQNDAELWSAAAIAPDDEAVGPPKPVSTALQAMREVTEELARERRQLERRAPPPADSSPESEVEPSGPEDLPRQEPEEPRRGRYVGLTGTGLHIHRHEHDPAPLDVTGELALARATLESYLRNADTADGATLELVGRMLDRISKMVSRVEAIRASDAIPRKAFVRIMGEVGTAVRLHCTPEQARAVTEHVMAIRV